MKRSPSNSRASGGTCASAWIPAAARWIALSASHGRAECPERPWKVQRRIDVAQAAGVDGVRGRLHHHHEVGGAQPRLALEQPGEGALGDRQLLAPEEHVAEVDRRRLARQRQLDHHGEGALHVGGAEAVDRVGVAPARAVALRGNGVEVARPGARAGAPALSRAGEHAGVARVARVDAASRRTPSTWAARAASSRDSDGTSTSSSVRAARRSARDTPRQATQLAPAGQAVGHGVEARRVGRPRRGALVGRRVGRAHAAAG